MKTTKAIRSWFEAAVELIYPRNCPLCSTPLGQDDPGVICPACLARVKWIEPPFCHQCALPFPGETTGAFVCGHCGDRKFQFSRTVCACRAEGVVRDTILRFKYNREMHLGRHLTDWMIAGAMRWMNWREVDAIVPVPLHPRKKRHREFNQAEYLGRALSQSANVPMLNGNLRRVKDTPTQTRLDAAARAANLRGAFQARRPAEICGKRLVLLDDVFTTGATLDSCARVLRMAGAQEVIALALARGV